MTLFVIGAVLLAVAGVAALVARFAGAARDIYIPIGVMSAYGAVATGIGGADVISSLV